MNDSRIDLGDFTSHNYGASIFSRFRSIQQIYLDAEFAYASYENATSYNITNKSWESKRVLVPLILLGSGFVEKISANTAAYVEVLVDVLQDYNSLYEDWDPIVSVDVGF
jgi:hypothetical protein